MPFILRLQTLLGILAPFLVCVAVLNGRVTGDPVSDFAYGDAKNLFELILVSTLALPIFATSVLLVMRVKRSPYYYLLGWLLLSLSPLCLSSVRGNIGIYLVELVFYVAIGMAFALYFYRSRDVESYFSAGE